MAGNPPKGTATVCNVTLPAGLALRKTSPELFHPSTKGTKAIMTEKHLASCSYPSGKDAWGKGKEYTEAICDYNSASSLCVCKMVLTEAFAPKVSSLLTPTILIERTKVRERTGDEMFHSMLPVSASL